MPQRIVDLTLPITHHMPRFPAYWHPDVEVVPLGHVASEGRNTSRLVLGSHTGTHCDATLHFIADGGDVASLPLQTLVGPARVLNCTDLAPGGELKQKRLQAALADEIPARLILRFDWSARWGTPAYYQDWPFLSLEAARWLVTSGVKLLAMDTPSPDNPIHGRDTPPDSPVHKIILAGGLVLVEYLNNLAALTRERVQLIALPLPIVGGDGSPTRCVAIEEE